MSTAKKVLQSTGFQILAKAINSVISIAIIKLITGYLGGVEGYGQYTAIYEYLAFFAVIADMGIYTLAVREMSENKERVGELFGNIYALRLVLVIALMIIAAGAVFFIPRYQESSIPLGVVLASISVLFTMLHGTISSLYQVLYKMGYVMLTQVLGKLVMLGYVVFTITYLTPVMGVSVDQGFYQLLIAGVVGNGIMFFWLYTNSSRHVEWTLQWDSAFWKKFIIEALPYGLALILNTIYFRVDSLLLTLLHDDGFAQVGLYGVAMRMLEAISVIPVYFMNSVLPIMSAATAKRGGELLKILNASFVFLLAIVMPMFVGGVIFAKEIILLVSTTDYVSAENYGSDVALQILFIALFFTFFNTLLGYVLVAKRQQSKLLWINAFGAMFNLIANILVIPQWGFIGAAFTSVLSEFVVIILLLGVTQTWLLLWKNLIYILKISFSAALMGVVVFLGQQYTTVYWLLFVVVGAFVYGVNIVVLGVMNEDVQKAIFGKKIF